MALGGGWMAWLLWLGALCIAFEARAEEGGIRLVFDASAERLPKPERTAPTPMTAPPAEPAFKRQWVGFHVAQDVAFVYGSSVCHRELGPRENFSCFYSGTDNEPFVHDSQRDHEDLDEGPTFATTRLLLSYDYAISPKASVGTRLGYALGGGPPAGQFPVEEDPSGDPNRIPAGTRGHHGSPFMPVHAELRANYWFLPLTSRSLRAYVGAGFGLAQVDSKHEVAVFDCAETLEPSWNPANGGFDDCMQETEDWNPVLDATFLDAWKTMGRGFVTASAGAALPIKGELSLVMNVNAMLMFPAEGFVLEPSVGIMTDL